MSAEERFKPYVVVLRSRDSALGATERAVLNAAAFRASGDAEVWASIELLAEDTALGDRTVRRDLRQLEALGILVAVDRRQGRPTRFRIVPEAIPARPTPAPGAAPPAPRAGVQAPTTPAPGAAPPAPGAAPPAPGADDPIFDPSIDPIPTPQPPPRPGVGELEPEDTPAVRWVSDRALVELAEVDDPEALRRRYVAGEGSLVDAWLRLSRPDRGRRAWPDAPSGLRQRDVVRGLRLAEARWRSGERPARPPPPDDESTRQLDLPEPLPELEAEPTEAVEVVQSRTSQEGEGPPAAGSDQKVVAGLPPSSAELEEKRRRALEAARARLGA